jgi:peptide/nickel transport system substrate-binding protein
MDAVLFGLAKPMFGAAPGTPTEVAWPQPHGFNTDIAKAKALLAEAGLADGFKTTIWTRPTGSLLNPNPTLGAQLLQADLAKVGIRAEIRVIEWGELIRRAKAGEHDLLFMGWAGDNGDPDNFLTPQFACASVQSGLNFARYCDPQLDKLIADGKAASAPEQRSALYQQAQTLIQQQALWLPLAQPTAFALHSNKVSGYQVSPFGRQDFAKVRLN